jgi:hypothetical protein
MNEGRILATASPAELKRQSGSDTIEDAFVALLLGTKRASFRTQRIAPPRGVARKVRTRRQPSTLFGFASGSVIACAAARSRSCHGNIPVAMEVSASLREFLSCFV